VTKTFVDLFVEEGEQVQAKESKEAFLFIEKQLNEYHVKLVDAENKLKDLRTKNYYARPGTETVVNEAIAGYRRKINTARLELQEAIIKRKSLEDQLSGEAEITTLATRDGQFRTRILNLQSQLDTLRLSYHEEHPDIVRTKRQIEDIKKTIIEEEKEKLEAKNDAKSKGELFVDEGVLLSPLYQQLRSDLSLTKTKVLTLRTRISATKKLMGEEFERLKRIGETEATLAELTRDYEVNRDMYTSLQTRREKANISMNLGNENTGPSFRIQEPARLPLVPSGIRFIHFLLAGLILGILIPIGIIYTFIYFDPRIRTYTQIEAKLNIPVLAVIPHICNSMEERASSLTNKYLMLIVFLVGALYVTFATLKILKVL
jgi:polysaccharide chain length determinant protein (PEP-CTERM system associated)